VKRLEGKRLRVVVAMSGGVDSSTVAGLLHEAGHEVVGVHMKLHPTGAGGAPDPSARTCCGLDDAADARRVAAALGIPFFVGDYQEVFEKAVVEPFVRAYAGGRTPNPCVRCNDTVKFRALLARARKLGADLLATGHYARTRIEEDGSVSLRRARDPEKDQSYFLAGIAPAALRKVVFPLGDLTKAEVRDHARRLGLPVAEKRESQDVCFLPDGDHGAFVLSRAEPGTVRPGALVSVDGTRLGSHRGLACYTVGQRKGLGVAGPERLYAVSLRPEENALVVGTSRDLLASGLTASSPSWIGDPPEPGDRVTARIRHRHAGASARIAAVGPDRVDVVFDRPVSAIAPGQQVALYDSRDGGDRVLGAATIEGPIEPGRAPARAPEAVDAG
jgi:tRNA-specific 2-thiouridylase